MRLDRRKLLWLLATLAAAPAQAAGLSEPRIRAFVAEQQRAWNAGAVDTYFASFHPGAIFTDQYLTPAGRIVPYGQSTRAKAIAQTRRFLSTSRVTETGRIQRIIISQGGRSARIVSRQVSHIQAAGRRRVVCAERVQTVELVAGRLLGTGQTDTYLRCAP